MTALPHPMDDAEVAQHMLDQLDQVNPIAVFTPDPAANDGDVIDATETPKVIDLMEALKQSLRAEPKPSPARKPQRLLINFQCAVNARLLNTPGFPRNRGEHGGVLTNAELRELEAAFDANESADVFADRIAARVERRIRRAEWLAGFQGQPCA